MSKDPFDGLDKDFPNWLQTTHNLVEVGGEVRLAPPPAPPPPPGCFRFDNGTTQGWTMRGPYDANTGNQESYLGVGPQLTNPQNLALQAAKPAPFHTPMESRNPVVLTDPQVKKFDIYLESPDLSQMQDWQGIKGFSLGLQVLYFSPVALIPPIGACFAQLQVDIEKADGASATIAEWDTAKGQALFHDVENGKHHEFEFTAQQIEDAAEVQKLRVRLSTPHIYSLEAGVRVRWFIGNVCPVPKT